MTRFRTSAMTREKGELLCDWLREEGIDPADVSDDGRLSVHNGVVSGTRWVKSGDGSRLTWKDSVVTTHFRQAQKNPLPEVLHV